MCKKTADFLERFSRTVSARFSLGALILAIAACGGGGGGGNTPEPPPGPPAAPTSATAQLGPNALTLELAGVGSVEVSTADASQSPVAKLTKTESAQSKAVMERNAPAFQVLDYSAHELELEFDRPLSENATIVLDVPPALLNARAADNAIAVYFENAWVADGEESYLPLPSMLDLSTGKVSATFPRELLNGADASRNVMRFKVGLAAAMAQPTPTSPSSRTPTGRVGRLDIGAPDEGSPLLVTEGGERLRCPLTTRCIETSRTGRRLRADGEWRQHTGMDLLGARGASVVSVLPGRVYLHPDGYNTVTIWSPERSMATQYLHMSRIDVAHGARVESGQTIGAVGNAAPPDVSVGYHLHFALHVFGNRVCESATECKYILSREDPFPRLISRMKIVRKSTGSTVPLNAEATLALTAEDINGLEVRSAIDNTSPPLGNIRIVEWQSSNASNLTVRPVESPIDNPYAPTPFGLLSKDPSKRNEAIAQNWTDMGAAVRARWAGTDGAYAEYEMGLLGNFYLLTYVNTECEVNGVPVQVNTSEYRCMGTLYPLTGFIRFRAGTPEPLNLRHEGGFNCLGMQVSLDPVNGGSFTYYGETGANPGSGSALRANFVFSPRTDMSATGTWQFTGDWRTVRQAPPGGYETIPIASRGTWTAVPIRAFPKCLQIDSLMPHRWPVCPVGSTACDFRSPTSPARPGEWFGLP